MGLGLVIAGMTLCAGTGLSITNPGVLPATVSYHGTFLIYGGPPSPDSQTLVQSLPSFVTDNGASVAAFSALYNHGDAYSRYQASNPHPQGVSVPDSGSTLGFLGASLAGLLALRRRLCR
jgi:hypothetical protein